MREVERRHGFEIMVEHVRLGRDHRFERAVALLEEIGRQHLDGSGGCRGPDRANRGRDMRGAAVGQVVAIHRGHDHMLKPERGNGVRHMLRLGLVERPRQPGLHVAEGAGARAGVAHDHHGRVALLPALADVRAAGLLADRVQAVLAHDLGRARIARRAGSLHANPRGLALHGRIRPRRPFPDAASCWRYRAPSCSRIEQLSLPRSLALLERTEPPSRLSTRVTIRPRFSSPVSSPRAARTPPRPSTATGLISQTGRQAQARKDGQLKACVSRVSSGSTFCISCPIRRGRDRCGRSLLLRLYVQGPFPPYRVECPDIIRNLDLRELEQPFLVFVLLE